MGENNLVKIDGKPLEKLIEVISKGIGTLYKPISIKKEAKAKAYEIEIIERAKAKALAEGKEIEAESLERIQERIIYKEQKRQKNIEQIYQIAAQQLSLEETISEEIVEDDWTTRFFNIVEDISNEEMQQLWGRILAGEVKQPKSYSLRTLELLKNLSKHEAEVFSKAANFVITCFDSPFLFKGNDDILDKYNLSFDDRLLLVETGLLQPDSYITRQLPQSDSDYIIYFESGKFILKAVKKANSSKKNINIIRFTKIGEELLTLLIPNSQNEYIKEFCQQLEEIDVEVEHAFIVSKNIDGTITHTNPWLKFTDL